MTYEEFTKLPFKYVSHLSLSDEHCATYATPDNQFGICNHTPYKDGLPYGRVTTHYRVGKKIFKTKKALIEALKEI